MPSNLSLAKKTPALLILAICTLWALSVTAHAADILKDLRTDPARPALEGKMTLVADLAGDTCNTEIRYAIDNRSLGGKNVLCDTAEERSRELNPSKEGYACGTHTATAQIYTDGVLVDNISKDIIIGNQPVISLIGDPVLGSEERILFKDPVTGTPVDNIRVRIYNIFEGKTSAKQYRTDANGSILFSPDYTGDHLLLIDEPDMCGELSFPVKKAYNIDGPYPPNPMVGDEVKLLLPAGVSMRVVDDAGNTYLAGNMSVEGRVNFTIDAPGKYTIAIGEESAIYSVKNVSINVSDKPGSMLKSEPSKALLGGSVLVTAYSGNASIKNARLTVSSDSKGPEEYTTDSEGKIIYTPSATGVYTVSFKDPGFQESNSSFYVSGILKAGYSPGNPRTDMDVTIEVMDESNHPAQGATVSVGGTALGTTGPDGKATIRITETGSHYLSVAKQDYAGDSLQLNVSSPLTVELSSADVVLDKEISIKSHDSQNREVSAEYVIVKPDGKQVTTGSPYKPDKAGNYKISARKDNYIGASIAFIVRPRPVDMTVNLAGDDLLLNVSSRGQPVAGLHILIESSTGTIDAVTNSKGKTSVQIKDTGELIITANPGNIDPDYGTSVKNQKIVKQREISSLLVIFVVIALLALLASVIVYVTPRKDKKGRGSSGSGQVQSGPQGRSREPYFDSGTGSSGLRKSPILDKKRSEYRHARAKDKKPAGSFFEKKEGSSLSRK